MVPKKCGNSLLNPWFRLGVLNRRMRFTTIIITVSGSLNHQMVTIDFHNAYCLFFVWSLFTHVSQGDVSSSGNAALHKRTPDVPGEAQQNAVWRRRISSRVNGNFIISGSKNEGTVPYFVGIFPYIGLKNRPYFW